MSNHNEKKINRLAVFFMAVFLAMSLSAQAEEKTQQSIKSSVVVGVVSFQAMIPDNNLENTVICPLCTAAYSTGRIQEGAEKIIEDIFTGKMGEFKEVRLIPQDRVQGIYKRVSSESFRKPLLDVLKKTGQELGADILAVGYIYRYVERVGYDYSVKSPASVAFEIYLVNASDGSIMWRGIFDKTQKSLMEDLFQISSFIRGGGKWLTAEQLSRQGMYEIFKKFPGFVR